MVKEFQGNNDVKQIRKLITILTDEFAVSHNPHSRKGGLIGLAATAIALGKVVLLVHSYILFFIYFLNCFHWCLNTFPVAFSFILILILIQDKNDTVLAKF